MADTSKSDPWWLQWQVLVPAAALLVVLAGVAGHFAHRPGDVHNAGAAFTTTPSGKQKPVSTTTNWPFYGYDVEHTRYLPTTKGPEPPFKALWKFGPVRLLEFSPILVRGRIYDIDNIGKAFALNARTGKLIWLRKVATLNASAFAFSRGRLFMASLEPQQIVALNPRNGHTLWRHSLPGRSESSPVVDGDRVYFGCECGSLYAVSAKDGHTIWSAKLGGPVKASPALYQGTLYVGDYGGTMSAVDARTGKVKWQSGSQGGGFGQSGEFYSTPAAGFGRIYSGNNDGRIYSYEASTGKIAWSHSTGGYVYAAPALAEVPGTPPTVYIGSFDGRFYALDAKTGSVRWSYDAGGIITGAGSVVGNTVYFANLNSGSTIGLDVRSGKPVFQIRKGAYNPVISDGKRIYLTGYSSLQALAPRSGPGRKKPLPQQVVIVSRNPAERGR